MPSIIAEAPTDPRPNSLASEPTPAAARSRSLSEAVAAVNEHVLRTEMRRVRRADAAMSASVTLPRSAARGVDVAASLRGPPGDAHGQERAAALSESRALRTST
jgi:hypothetical protein